MHEKRLTAPRTWKISRKELEWTTPISPGTHSKEQAVPLVVLIRDVLKIVRDKREVKTLLNQGKIKVDLKTRKNLGFPVGVLDSISINDNTFRVIIKKGKIWAIPTNDGDKKIVKIEKKKKLGDGFQYRFHDGNNITSQEEYGRRNSLLLKLPEQEVEKEISLEKGSQVLVYKGGHKGKIAKIKNIRKMKLEDDKVILKHNGEEFETLLDYVIVVGKKKPLIKLKGEEK